MIEEENSLPCSQVLCFGVLPQSWSFEERLQTQTQPKWAVPLQGIKETALELCSQLFSALPHWCLQVVGCRRCFSSFQPHSLGTPRKSYWGSTSSGQSFATHMGSFKITISSDLLLPASNRLFLLSHFCVILHCLIPTNLSHLCPLLCSLYYNQSPILLLSLKFSQFLFLCNKPSHVYTSIFPQKCQNSKIFMLLHYSVKFRA